MFLGLPWTAWLLIAVAILPCLGVILRFYALHHVPGAFVDGGEE